MRKDVVYASNKKNTKIFFTNNSDCNFGIGIFFVYQNDIYGERNKIFTK